ncbi:MAG: 3-methyladenine DNA glycosylase [Rhodothermales bacterium]
MPSNVHRTSAYGSIMPLPVYVHTVLSRAEWTEARNAHAERVDRLIGRHVERRSRHEKDPVADFLFEYYRFRPSALARWSPGFGWGLEDAPADVLDATLARRSGDGVTHLDAEAFPMRHLPGTRFIRDVLERTQGRLPLFGCAGLHEWAMVYRTADVRHDHVPLRLTPDEIADVVERGPLCCTHYDAFRFFTPAATPLNRSALSVDDMLERDQPGCLHVNMDLYRWAFKRAPWVGSDLILDALELAFDIREVDMRASPYNLSEQGLVPIRVELDEGRAEYAGLQRAFHRRAAPLRNRLLDSYTALLDAVASVASGDPVS